MSAAEGILFEFGAIMLIAFIGAALANRFRQSVILGYMMAGILIGPNIHISAAGIQYDGLFTNEGLITGMSELGLILLMFFVGLEFSVSKLKRTKSPAILLAVMNLGINMFAGIMLGTALGWPLMDTVFLAGVIAMSSCAITAKSLIDLKRLENPETEFLLGMVIVEDFLSMLLLTIAAGLMAKGDGGAVDLTTMMVGIVAFYAFFIFLAVLVIPRVVRHLESIRNEELFVLFALGIVFLSAALAEASYVPGIIGAFFIGMVFAETKVSERFHSKLLPFKDAFVAIFFVTFGMMIDLSRVPDVLGMVLIAVPLVVINDVLVTAALAYFIGFSSRGAVSMGTSLCGRGAESVMYASVGSSAVGATKGAELYPFAGVFCFVMSIVTPVMMRNSLRVTRWFQAHLPMYLRYSGAVVSRTFGKAVMPQSLRLYRPKRGVGPSLVAYAATLIAVLLTTGEGHVIALAAGLVVTAVTHKLVSRRMDPIIQHTNYTNLGMVARDRSTVRRFVSYLISISLLAIMMVAFVATYAWWLSIVIILLYIVVMLRLMAWHHSRTYGGVGAHRATMSGHVVPTSLEPSLGRGADEGLAIRLDDDRLL